MNQTDSLDYVYSSHAAVPRILQDFSALCVNAAMVKNEYCPFAVNSLNAPNPSADLNGRINYIVGNLTANTYISPKSGKLVSLFALSSLVRSCLGNIESFSLLAQSFNLAEDVIRHTNPINLILPADIFSAENSTEDLDRRSTESRNITTASYNASDPFTGSVNGFAWPAIVCLDQNNPFPSVDSFVDKWQPQMENNSLIGTLSKSMAMCLTWPDLRAYDVERVDTLELPKNLSNKILVIGVRTIL
jgi:hypothetical protein